MNLNVLVEGDMDREIKGGYCGDLLSSIFASVGYVTVNRLISMPRGGVVTSAAVVTSPYDIHTAATVAVAKISRVISPS